MFSQRCFLVFYSLYCNRQWEETGNVGRSVREGHQTKTAASGTMASIYGSQAQHVELSSYQESSLGKTWVSSYDPETTQEFQQWNSQKCPKLEKAWKCTERRVAYFDIHRVVHQEFVSCGQTVFNHKILTENIRLKQPELRHYGMLTYENWWVTSGTLPWTSNWSREENISVSQQPGWLNFHVEDCDWWPEVGLQLPPKPKTGVLTVEEKVIPEQDKARQVWGAPKACSMFSSTFTGAAVLSSTLRSRERTFGAKNLNRGALAFGLPNGLRHQSQHGAHAWPNKTISALHLPY